MRVPTAFFLSCAATVAALGAQCPYYSNGAISAGLSRFGGGEDVRFVYVDCLQSIGLVQAKFGTTNGSGNLNGLPLKIAVYTDPTNDHDPHDAILVSLATIPGGVTGGNTGQWQTYDLNALFGAPVPATGGMWVAVGVAYPASTSPGPGSIEFFNNVAPGTQWLGTDSNLAGFNYATPGANALVDIQTGPGFPPGSWVIRVESGAEYRPFGSGCPGSNGTPTLVGGVIRPVPGLAAVYDASHLPLTPVADFLILGLAVQSPAVDIGTVLGGVANGCLVRVQPLATPLLANNAGSAQYAVPLPGLTSLLGLSVFGQVVSFDAPANAVGVTASNVVRAVIGY